MGKFAVSRAAERITGAGISGAIPATTRASRAAEARERASRCRGPNAVYTLDAGLYARGFNVRAYNRGEIQA